MKPGSFRGGVGMSGPLIRRLRAAKVLMHALVASRRSDEHGAVTVAVGIVAALVLILSGAAVVQLSSGNLRGVFASSDSRQARGAAAEGTELMIDSWNQPQNRRLLVSGQSPTDWNAANLRSPCFESSTNTRPGPNNDGLPDQAAINLGDGQWRNVVSGAVATATQDGRQFRLVRISFTASDGGATPNPRGLRRTATPGAAATGATLPTGVTSWDQLVNLDDPDGLGNAQPGSNRGFVVLEVEGRVVRNGQVVANSRETREFEVLPKCCGASLGSNNSGGMNYAGTTGSLGSDSRVCNLQYGVVTGFNDGWHWSYFANDQFTQRNPLTGAVERYSPILGVVANPGDIFERRNCRVRPGRGKLESGNCPETFQSGDPRGTDSSRNTQIVNAGAPDANEQICRQPANSTSYFSGPDSDIRGTSASCSTIVPLQATAFPNINDFILGWTAGWGPRNIITQATATTNQVANAAIWPSLNTDNGDGTRPNSQATLRLRTNNEANRQRAELCLTDRTTASSDNCTANTWLNVTASAAPNSNFYGLGASATGSQTPLSAGNPSTTSSPATNLTIFGNATTANTRLFRDVNLDSFTGPRLQTPLLEFAVQRTSGFDSNDLLIVEASPDGGTTYYPLTSASIPGSAITTSSTGTTFRLGLPFSGSNVRIQFRDGNGWENNENITIRDLEIRSSTATPPTASTQSRFPILRGPWCQFSSSSPVTAEPGFHCLGPTINQFDGGTVFIDTTGGPLSLLYNEPTTTDRRFGIANTANPERFIFISQSPAQFTHVFCPSIEAECDDVIDDETYNFSAVGEPDRLNFFGRNTGTAGQEQNISITTPFGETAKVGGVWFYLPQGFVELTIDDDGASSIPVGFYTDNEDNWSFYGRIWVKNFRPYGAFHLRLPDSRVDGALGVANPAQFTTQSGVDWVARATTSTRLW
jgi:hypothetical protein